MMKPLWYSHEIIKAIKHKKAQNISNQGEISGISIDTRTIKMGEVFFAIKGDRFDGHDYVAKAKENGAIFSVIDNNYYTKMQTELKGYNLLVVKDVLSALNQLAIASRKRMKGNVIAITGSAGKTTTKELMRTAFKKYAITHAAKASFNNHWGVPFTLANMPRECEIGIFEIGMNNKGEIKPLAKMVKPNIAIITNIAPVHIGAFKSLKEIAKEKADIFKGFSKSGVAIINGDTSFSKLLQKRVQKSKAEKIICFGEKESNDAYIMSYNISQNLSTINAKIEDAELIYKLNLIGMHHAINSLAVLTAVKNLGYDLALSALKLNNLQPLKGRGKSQIYDIKNGSFTLIDESYNANPLSMYAAIDNLKYWHNKKGGRKIIVIGDMLELGEKAKEYHEQLSNIIKDTKIDMVFACGEFMRFLAKKLENNVPVFYEENSEQLKNKVLENILSDDLIMVKGSLGSKMSVIIDEIDKKFR